eukprot:140497_1
MAINLIEESVKAAVAEALSASAKENIESKRVILYLGTNNWQSKAEAACGSGILQRIHHETFNAMPNVSCYSMWPTNRSIQKNSDFGEDVCVNELKSDIPMMEAYGPVSQILWREVDENFFNSYIEKQCDLMNKFMDDIEKREGQNINLILCNHAFMNSICVNKVLKSRKAAYEKSGGILPNLAVFIHGTSTKMYNHELKLQEMDEHKDKTDGKKAKIGYGYYYALMNTIDIFGEDHGTFGNADCILSISKKNTNEFKALFPKYDPTRIISSPNGVNTNMFYPKSGQFQIDDIYAELSIKVQIKEAKIVLFVGRLADWKRVDCLVRAASIYEKEFKDTITIIVGGGLEDQVNKIKDLNVELKTENVYFVGPRMHFMLSKLYSFANIGVFPSLNEPFGMVFIECMACGTPVIGANSGGPKDFVTDEVGYLVPETEDRVEFSKRLANSVIDSLKHDWKQSKTAACIQLSKGYTVQQQATNILLHNMLLCDFHVLPPSKL